MPTRGSLTDPVAPPPESSHQPTFTPNSISHSDWSSAAAKCAQDGRQQGTAVNRVSAASVVMGETVGAIGGGGRWKSTDSRTETRLVPWTGIPMLGHAPNSLYWPTLSGESLSPVCTASKSIKPLGRPMMPTRSQSPNCARSGQDVWRSLIESRQHRRRGTSEASYLSLSISRPRRAIEYGSRQTRRSISGRKREGSPSDVRSHRSNGLSGSRTRSITRRSGTGSGCRCLEAGN